MFTVLLPQARHSSKHFAHINSIFTTALRARHYFHFKNKETEADRLKMKAQYLEHNLNLNQ